MSSHHKVMATFNFKSVDDKKWFLNLLDGDDGLSVTRKAEGNVDIQLCTSNLDECQVLVWQTWETQANHEAYLQMRKDSGLFDEVTSRLNGELQINRLTHVA